MKKHLFIFILTCVVSACSSGDDTILSSDDRYGTRGQYDSNIEMNPESYYGREPLAKHVFLFALDGWGSHWWDESETPTFKELAKNGIYTLKKRSVYPSVSAPNWSSMFMSVPPETHGYMTWGSPVPDVEPMAKNSNGHFPTIFSELNEQQPEKIVGAYYQWATIGNIIDSKAVDFHQCFPDLDPNRQGGNANDRSMMRAAIKCIKEKKPNLFAVCWDTTDHIGHSFGWGSPQYIEEVEDVDEQVSLLIQATKDAGIYDESIFILSSDHGGINFGHGGYHIQEMETPYVISGKNIVKGEMFTSTIHQYDVAATIAYIFGVRAPKAWIGKAPREAFLK